MTEKNYEEFVLLWTKHQRQVWWFINSLLPAANDADDVLQETSVVLWRKWDEYDRTREFLPWACGIARLQVLRFVREHRTQRQHLNEKALMEIAEVAQKEVQRLAHVETRLTALRKCIQTLDSAERNIVESRYLRAKTIKAIAENLGKPAVTIYKTLARTRIQLMDCVNRRLSALEIS